MATISDARAIYGLSVLASPIGTNVSGSFTVGIPQTQARLDSANVVYSVRAIIANGDDFALNLSTGSTSGSTAFVAGAAQVDTNTIVAAGGCTSNGSMVLVVTAAGMTGSPKNVSVALTTTEHLTAALIATAARTALAADTAVAAMFSVGGTGADITLTRIPTYTYTVPGGTLNFYAANDATLNLAIPSGLGVTASASSTNTTTGVITSGVKIYDGDGNDAEGVALVAISTHDGICYQMATGSGDGQIVGGTETVDLFAGETILRVFGSGGASENGAITITATTAVPSDVNVTVIGATA